MDNQRGISFVGSVALLVSSMTGPGLVTIPLLFQTSGWLFPTITFFIAMSLGATSSLLLCETLTNIHGNEKFQRKIEFTHLSNVLVQKHKVRIMIQVILYLAIESVIIASIILSTQSMDLMLLRIAGKTCGLGFQPNLGFFCITEAIDESSPFGTNYVLATFGFMITLIFCVPLSFMDLIDNIIVQIASFATLVFIVITWIATFIMSGLHKDYVPLVSDNQSQVVGTVLFNYAFITTVPSWVNDLRPDVSIRKAIWYSVVICTVAYMLLGILGGMTYQMDLSSNIIAEIDESSHRSMITDIATFLFPVAVLLTSIPVDSIVVRYNLERSGLCKKRMATLLSTLLPWIIVLPFQSGFWLNIFTNWTSLLFTSTSNFIIPFYLYYLSQSQKDSISSEKDVEFIMIPKDDLHETRKLIEPSTPTTPSAVETLPTTSFTNPDKRQLFGASIGTIIERATNIIGGATRKNHNNNDNSNQGLYYHNNHSIDNINDNASTTSDDDTWPVHSPNETFVAFPIKKRSRMIIAMIAGIVAVILVCVIIFYDFVKLALGNNVLIYLKIVKSLKGGQG